MHITIALSFARGDQDQSPLNIDVGSDMTQADLKAVVEADTQIPPKRQALMFNGSPLQDDAKTLQESDIKDGDLLELQEWKTEPHVYKEGPQAQPNDADRAERLRINAMESPRVMEQLRQFQPLLADAVNDARLFRELWTRMKRAEDAAAATRERETQALDANPMDIEAQRRIEESIREQAVASNLQTALDNTPEAFGKVHMLYIYAEVNGHPVKAFVDSGAQTTVMSPTCAEECGIMRLLDKRFSGTARGAGTAHIFGRVHSAQIKIGSLFLPCAFTVMEGKEVHLLFGLDMLKRYQACIDLKKGALIIMDNEIPFLAEADIPKISEEEEEPTVEGPAGFQVGGRTGALMPPSAERSETQQGQPQTQRQVQRLGVSPQEMQQYQRQQQQQEQQATFPDEAVTHLMGLGFSRENCLKAMRLARGNVELAAGILYE